jgi:Na+-translocating ferredoxin:NAD+ oxidoreductase RnfG subunit
MGLFLRSLWDSKRQSVSTVFIYACIIFIFVRSGFAEELIKVEGALKKMFPAAGHFDRQIVSLSKEQIRRVEEAARLTFEGKHSDQVIVHIAREQNTVVGYAFEDTVIGKWGLIHYLVGLDTSGAGSRIIILDYQEIRGRPIAKPRFLRQYQGKTLKDTLQLRKDIDGITGATISSNSLTEGVRKILHMYELIKPELH